MKELVFQVELKSDIVLSATSNTEGKIDQLDFIAGSNFLGMAAKKYDKFSNSFNIFHSGKVRFGDAHILKDDKMTYKIPYSFVHEKLKTEPIYNYYKLEKDDFDKLGQLKQLRNGYITSDKEQVFVDYVYSQKSAYDKNARTSKQGQMYGYKAIKKGSLKKGSLWRFVVKIDDISHDDEQLVIDTLQNSVKLGRSKSAEYGQIKIEYLSSQARENIEKENSNLQNNEVVLYCNSRLSLIDENGNPTYELKYLCDGLVDENIIHQKTQIRTSTFTPYNTARATKDYERVCINKGSVIVLKNITDEQLRKIKNGVGAFLSEGFGEIFVNPGFLMEKEFVFAPKLQVCAKKDKRQKVTEIFKDTTAQFLANRHNAMIDMLDIAGEAAMFVENHQKSTFKDIKPSQWGNIRSVASGNQDVFIEKIRAYISNGARKWEDKQVEVLMRAIDSHKIDKQKFTKLLAMQMSKVTEKSKGAKNG